MKIIILCSRLAKDGILRTKIEKVNIWLFYILKGCKLGQEFPHASPHLSTGPIPLRQLASINGTVSAGYVEPDRSGHRGLLSLSDSNSTRRQSSSCDREDCSMVYISSLSQDSLCWRVHCSCDLPFDCTSKYEILRSFDYRFWVNCNVKIFWREYFRDENAFRYPGAQFK
jgi:hypothetical protein